MDEAATSKSRTLKIGNSEILPHQLACMEVWGGNTYINSPVELPGLNGWIHSKPLEPATSGGDVYYLSVCSAGNLSRIMLADVAGHGQGVGPIAVKLRDLVRKHINTLDQTALMRGITKPLAILTASHSNTPRRPCWAIIRKHANWFLPTRAIRPCCGIAPPKGNGIGCVRMILSRKKT